ncbi:hypothetical protein E2C01_005179 [Portunus trituberculatus]|uniref:Uncharacterized protein n=1 Tax=Portunus trituberculatus TaxID=210409 RepID=A0A5B7CUG9_PORTR|nr:hypothetical protein [Portunus trituberculatus]
MKGELTLLCRFVPLTPEPQQDVYWHKSLASSLLSIFSPASGSPPAFSSRCPPHARFTPPLSASGHPHLSLPATAGSASAALPTLTQRDSQLSFLLGHRITSPPHCLVECNLPVRPPALPSEDEWPPSAPRRHPQKSPAALSRPAGMTDDPARTPPQNRLRGVKGNDHRFYSQD